MVRKEHIVAAFVAVLSMAACGREQKSEHQMAEAQAPASPAPADAAAPREAHVLDPARWQDVRVRNAYAAAQKYAQVLEQLYCYCRCKENLGHRALIECYESDHASECDVCMTEALMAARMTEQGRTPKEIQKAIDQYYRT